MRSSASASSVRVTAVLDFSNLFIIQRLFIYDSTRRSPPTASGSQLRLLQSLELRMCKTKGVRTFGSTAAEIVCRGATLNTLSSFGFNCVYYALRVEG